MSSFINTIMNVELRQWMILIENQTAANLLISQASAFAIMTNLRMMTIWSGSSDNQTIIRRIRSAAG
jgi:hypothetical protein